MKKKMQFYLGIFLGKPFIKLLFLLNKKTILNGRNTIIDGENPVIICSWHGRLIFPFYYLRNKGLFVVAGFHRDAEIISRISEKMGWKLIRGSSTKGGDKAYDKIIHALQQLKCSVAITPDGPKGPKRKVKPGAVMAALKTGATLIPVSGGASRSWEAKNWDVFIIPKPFGRVVLTYGEPIKASKRDTLESLSIKLEAALNQAQMQADEYLKQ